MQGTNPPIGRSLRFLDNPQSLTVSENVQICCWCWPPSPFSQNTAQRRRNNNTLPPPLPMGEYRERDYRWIAFEMQRNGSSDSITCHIASMCLLWQKASRKRELNTETAMTRWTYVVFRGECRVWRTWADWATCSSLPSLHHYLCNINGRPLLLSRQDVYDLMITVFFTVNAMPNRSLPLQPSSA